MTILVPATRSGITERDCSWRSTQMLALGIDPKTIQALVGHAEIDMTMYYAHAQESSKQAAISRYDEAFSASGGGLYGNILTFVKSG